MNLLLLFMVGLVFLTSLYGMSQAYAVNWLFVIGLIFSSFVIGLILGE